VDICKYPVAGHGLTHKFHTESMTRRAMGAIAAYKPSAGKLLFFPVRAAQGGDNAVGIGYKSCELNGPLDRHGKRA
jgi:hypothetical protein